MSTVVQMLGLAFFIASVYLHRSLELSECSVIALGTYRLAIVQAVLR